VSVIDLVCHVHLFGNICSISDGIGRSGTFCSLYSVLERVKIEQVVDVLQAIKAMRIPRPGLVKTNVSTTILATLPWRHMQNIFRVFVAVSLFQFHHMYT
jgi:hypothetical protein